MKKTLKFLLIFVFGFILFSLGQQVKANTIKDLSMDIYIDNNGDAYVTETWVGNDTEKTEHYHTFNNLGNSVISDLSVTFNNREFTYLTSWNVNGSFSSKAYKCGLNHTSSGTEVCWGISEYGKNNTYVAKYKISNFVSNGTDSQIIYWNLIDFSQDIKRAYIKIHSDFDYASDTPVWGYGNYGGTCYVYDGYIEMESDGTLDDSEYMVILAKFPLGTFNCTDSLGHDFTYYSNMAERGATKYTESAGKAFSSILGGLIGMFFMIFLSPAFWVILIIILVGAKTTNKKYEFGEAGKTFSKEIPYYRDIPCKNDLFRAYYVAHQYGLLKKKTDLLGAIILKWLRDNLIRIDQKEVGVIFKKEDTVIILNETDPEYITDPYEKKLFNMLNIASKDGILENKEFEKWCGRSYSTLLAWFDSIIKKQEEQLIIEGLVEVEESDKKFFKKKTYRMTPAIRTIAEQIYGLKQYLIDYTLIKDRKPMEVHLLEDYLIYAQMLGIAKQVAKDFKDLYPDILAQSTFNSYDHIIFINNCATRGAIAATSAQSRAQSYSSGGGGFSSGGGGGGSHGGGGGGSR